MAHGSQELHRQSAWRPQQDGGANKTAVKKRQHRQRQLKSFLQRTGHRFHRADHHGV